MKTIRVGDRFLAVKDYYCAQGESYIPRNDGKLWLYVNMTDVCPGKCPFCVNPGRQGGTSAFDIHHFQKTLSMIKTYVKGVSFTGGEPMMEPVLLDEAISSVSKIMGNSVEIDLVTSGVNLVDLLSLSAMDFLDSIHISRHYINDLENRQFMGSAVPSGTEIKEMIAALSDPAKIVLNCMLQKDGISDIDDIADYLDFAAGLGVCNVSFIGMIEANSYCRENYINPGEIGFSKDSRFRIWNRFQDHDYCSCSSGDYFTGSKWIRFYYRSPGMQKPPYARQLVYTDDNKLLDGFGGKEIVL